MIDVLKQYTRPPLRWMLQRCRTIIALVAACMTAIPLTLSSTDAGAQEVIWESGDQIVQLIRQDDDTAAPNEHPVGMSPDEVQAMLRLLRLRYTDEEGDVASVSVFTNDEIDNLGKAIAIGLGRAAPSQDVIFHVIGARRLSQGAFGKRNRVSAGRIFYRDGNLNIIFGQVQTPYRKKNIYGQREEDFYPRNYGSRTVETEHDFILLPDSPAALNQSGAGVRDDWIIIQPGTQVLVDLPDEQSDSVSADGVAAAVGVAGVAAADSAPAANADNAASGQLEGTSTLPSTASVEQRLQELKRLRDLELISEEAYQARMKEILQDL
jgi:hypothetical protein